MSRIKISFHWFYLDLLPGAITCLNKQSLGAKNRSYLEQSTKLNPKEGKEDLPIWPTVPKLRNLFIITVFDSCKEILPIPEQDSLNQRKQEVSGMTSLPVSWSDTEKLPWVFTNLNLFVVCSLKKRSKNELNNWILTSWSENAFSLS